MDLMCTIVIKKTKKQKQCHVIGLHMLFETKCINAIASVTKVELTP